MLPILPRRLVLGGALAMPFVRTAAAQQTMEFVAGSLGGTLETGRVMDYTDKGDANRKLCSMYLSMMDRMGVKLDKFGDADTRLAQL